MSILRNKIWQVWCLILSTSICQSTVADSSLSLNQAVELALANDPWLVGSVHRQQALVMQGEAAAELPNPMISVGAANLPVDSFDTNQEPMTQLKVGLSQSFPRGETRKLRQRQLNILSSQQPDLREERQAKMRLEVTTLWLDAYRYRESIRQIEQGRALFEYLVDVAESSYRSASGSTRQQDLVRAQLELTRLDDRLSVLRQREETNLARLTEWLPGFRLHDFQLDTEMPTLDFAAPVTNLSGELLIASLLSHPQIATLDKKIAISGTGVDLAKQQFKPEWSINSSYAYRDDDPVGNDRSDFFSVGVSLDIPLFGTNRQDKQLQAALAMQEAEKTDKALALRALQSRFASARARHARLNERLSLYDTRLIREIHDQAEASLTAYTNDEGDFSEVVRARIAELNAHIDLLNLKIDQLIVVAETNYILAPGAEMVESQNSSIHSLEAGITGHE